MASRPPSAHEGHHRRGISASRGDGAGAAGSESHEEALARARQEAFAERMALQRKMSRHMLRQSSAEVQEALPLAPGSPTRPGTASPQYSDTPPHHHGRPATSGDSRSSGYGRARSRGGARTSYASDGYPMYSDVHDGQGGSGAEGRDGAYGSQSSNNNNNNQDTGDVETVRERRERRKREEIERHEAALEEARRAAFEDRLALKARVGSQHAPSR